jgi:hypothetical protein
LTFSFFHITIYKWQIYRLFTALNSKFRALLIFNIRAG